MRDRLGRANVWATATATACEIAVKQLRPLLWFHESTVVPLDVILDTLKKIQQIDAQPSRVCYQQSRLHAVAMPGWLHSHKPCRYEFQLVPYHLDEH